MQATNPNGQARPVVSTHGTKLPAPTADTAHNQGKPPHKSHDKFLKLGDVIGRVGLSRTSIYNFMAQGLFPAKIKLGRSTVWSEIAVNQWMDDQKTGGAV